jgi:hypothetical protein
MLQPSPARGACHLVKPRSPIAQDRRALWCYGIFARAAVVPLQERLNPDYPYLNATSTRERP